MIARELRLKHGYSNLEFSFMLRISPETLKAKEIGRRPWKYEEIEFMSRVFHISIHNLYYLLNNDEKSRTDLVIDNREELKIGTGENY